MVKFFHVYDICGGFHAPEIEVRPLNRPGNRLSFRNSQSDPSHEKHVDRCLRVLRGCENVGRKEKAEP